MATSNQEILAQLEKLAEDVALSGDDRACIRNILAAFKRLVKIEEAAKRCDFEGLAEYFDTEQFIYKRWGGERGSCELQNDLRALDAALKQGEGQ